MQDEEKGLYMFPPELKEIAKDMVKDKFFIACVALSAIVFIYLSIASFL